MAMHAEHLTENANWHYRRRDTRVETYIGYITYLYLFNRLGRRNSSLIT